MAKLTDTPLEQLPQGQAGEASLPGKPVNAPGVYEHKAASEAQGRPVRLIVLPDPTTNAQADALVRMGYEWVAPAPSRVELLQMQKDQAAKDAAAEKKGEVPAEPVAQAETFNGSSDRMSAADKYSALKAALARAEAAESALAEAVDFNQAEAPAAPVEPEVAPEADPAPDVEAPAEDVSEQNNEEGK